MSKSLKVIQDDLYEIWKIALEKDKFDLETNFFDLGGSSMMAIKMVMEINRKFETNFTILDLFSKSNILALSQYIHDFLNTDRHQILERQTDDPLDALNIINNED